MSKTKVTAEAGVPFIDITRDFAAPRDLLFRAYTDPDLVAQWLGPRDMKMVIDRYEVKDGGVWRYVHVDPEGNEYGFHGVFHGTPSPDGTVQTFEYEGAPGHVSLGSLSFEEGDGRTIVRVHSVYQSVEARDAVLESGMERGMNEGYERLEELVARLIPVA